MDQNQLKPCPFCGGSAELKHLGEHFGASCADWKCQGMQGALMHRAAVSAVAAWNRRAALASDAAGAPVGYVNIRALTQLADGCWAIINPRSEGDATHALYAAPVAPAAAAPEGWKPMPPKITAEMRRSMIETAREYMERTGGNSPEAMYEAAFAAAPAVAPAAVAPSEPRNVNGMTRAEFEAHLRVCYQHDNVRAQERGIGQKWNGPVGLTAEDEREIAERVERSYPSSAFDYTAQACPGCSAFDSGASEVEFVQGCEGCKARMQKIAGFGPLLAAAPTPTVAADAAEPINLEGLRKKLLTPRKILRDENGWLTHPDYPVCDEGTRADKFLEAFGIETRFRSMESDLPDFAERWHEDGLTDCSEWTPTPPEGDGWLLLEIYDTEDGPYAMFGRDKYEAENALKRRRTRELSERIQQHQAAQGDEQ